MSNKLRTLYDNTKKKKVNELISEYKENIKESRNKDKAITYYQNKLFIEIDGNKDKLITIYDETDSLILHSFIAEEEIHDDLNTVLNNVRNDLNEYASPERLAYFKTRLFDKLDEDAIFLLAKSVAYHEVYENFTTITAKKEKECVPDKLYWELENGVDSSVIKEIFNFLQENRGFISPDTEFKQFKKVFTNHDKDKNFTGISWIKPVNYLYYFVRHMKNQKIIKKVNCMYEVAAHLFTENGKKLSAIQIKSNTKPNDTIEEAFINFLSKHK